MSAQRLSRQYTKLECPECRAPVASNNFKRHWARHHQVNPGARTLESGLAKSPDKQQGHSSVDLTTEDPNLGNRMSITPSTSSSSIVTAATATAQYSMAARALLKCMSHYTEAGLMAFLEDKYPEIPANHRHCLVVGAVTGAQTAAQLYVLLDGAKSGKDRGSRETTEGARRMLSFYNLGLMSEDPSDPHPQIRLSPKPSSSSKCQAPLPMELPEARGESEEPVISAPVKGVGRQEEEPLASEEEEGDDTQSTTRAIELVELEIPGTQPCNRPGTSGRERARSASPTADAYHAALARECAYYMSVSERIRQQVEHETLEEARTKPPGDSNPDSEGVPPSPPPQRERRSELPLLLRVPPPSFTATSAMPHIPAAVVSAAAAALRQAQPSTSGIRSFIPTGRLYPGTTIRTSLTRPPTPRPPGDTASRATATKGTTSRRSPSRKREGASRRPPPRQQSPARDSSRHGRSVSPRGRHRASRSCSPTDGERTKDRRERDRSHRR